MDRGTKEIIGGGAGKAKPEIGLYPFEQTYAPDDENPEVMRRRFHLGTPVVKIFDTKDALIAAGFPRAHIDGFSVRNPAGNPSTALGLVP
jgi:hypothetical protein